MHLIVTLSFAFLVVAIVVAAYTIPASWREQRNEARHQLKDSHDEIARRDKIQFAVSVDDPELLNDLGSIVMRGKNFGTPTGLFVTVYNENGPACRFSADIDLLDMGDVSRLDGLPQRTYWTHAAWERTYESETIEIGPHTRVQRDIVNTFSNDSGRAFRFMAPEIQAWNEGAHGKGLEFVPRSDTFQFRLTIINHSTQQLMVRYGLVRFVGEAVSFTLGDSPHDLGVSAVPSKATP